MLRGAKGPLQGKTKFFSAKKKEIVHKALVSDRMLRLDHLGTHWLCNQCSALSSRKLALSSDAVIYSFESTFGVDNLCLMPPYLPTTMPPPLLVPSGVNNLHLLQRYLLTKKICHRL